MANGGAAAWSPTGRWFLVWSDAAPGTVELRTASGERVRTLPGDRAIWLDPESFVVRSATSASLYRVDAAAPTTVSLPDGKVPISNGRGAIAVNVGDSLPGAYVIWTTAGQRGPYPGTTLAWSPDGRQLAVGHLEAHPRGAVTGWIEVRSWPDTAAVTSYRHLDVFVDGARFDPTGRYLLLPSDGTLIDTSSGSIVRGLATASGSWDAAGHILLSGAGPIIELDRDGAQLARLPADVDVLVGTPDGATVVGYGSGGGVQPTAALYVVRAGGVTKVPLPGPPWPSQGVYLSPDGASAVIGCTIDGFSRILLVRL